MNTQIDVLTELESRVLSALSFYSNVHRGSGLKSQISTDLYEKARKIVLEYLELDSSKFLLIFCSPRRAQKYTADFEPEEYHLINSNEIGLQLGLFALAIKKASLKKMGNLESGGGTAKLFAKEWVIQSGAPSLYEAGTPPVINAICFAIGLQLVKKHGKDVFLNIKKELNVSEILYDDGGLEGKELLDRLRKGIIGKDVKVPLSDGMQHFVNLDHGASTSAFTPAWEAYKNSWIGVDAEEMSKHVKSVCSDVLNAPMKNYDVILTANTTEAINIVSDFMDHDTDLVLTSFMEHSSNDLPWRKGAGVIHLSADFNGLFNTEELESLLKEYNQDKLHDNQRIKLVALTGASNVLGFCNDLGKLAPIAHQYDAYLLVDAAQLVAHHSIDIETTGIDFLAFSGHKAYAPFGSGALIARKGIFDFPEGLRQNCGLENVAGNAAMGKSLYLLKNVGLGLIQKEESILTKRLLEGLKAIDKVNVYGASDTGAADLDKKLGVVPFEIKGEMPSKTAKNLSLFGGIGIRSGCFCAHMTVKHILKVTPNVEAIQKFLTKAIPGMKFLGVARASIGIENSLEDVDHLLSVLSLIASKDKRTQISRNPIKKLHKTFISDETKKVFPG